MHCSCLAVRRNSSIRSRCIEHAVRYFNLLKQIALVKLKQHLIAPLHTQQAIYFDDRSGLTWEITTTRTDSAADPEAREIVDRWIARHR